MKSKRQLNCGSAAIAKRPDLTALNQTPEARARAREHMRKLNADPDFAKARNERCKSFPRVSPYANLSAHTREFLRFLTRTKKLSSAEARRIAGVS